MTKRQRKARSKAMRHHPTGAQFVRVGTGPQSTMIQHADFVMHQPEAKCRICKRERFWFVLRHPFKH